MADMQPINNLLCFSTSVLFVISIMLALESISFAFCNASFISSSRSVLPFFFLGGIDLGVLVFFVFGSGLAIVASLVTWSGSDDELEVTAHPKNFSLVSS